MSSVPYRRGTWEEVDTGPGGVTRTRIGGSNEIVRVHDGAPATVERDWTRSPDSGISSAASAELPELLDSQSPVEIVLTRTARQTMLEDLFWSTRCDKLEAGGFLFAKPTRSWVKSVEVLSASETGNATRTSGSIKLDVAPWAQLERASLDGRTDLQLVGPWHSHPSRDDRPSDADLVAWLAALDWHEENNRSAAYSLGLICSASEYFGDSWATPRLSGWVVRRMEPASESRFA